MSQCCMKRMQGSVHNTGCGYHFKKVTVMNAVILKSNSFIGKENPHS